MRTDLVSWFRRLGVLAGVALGAAGLGLEGTLPAQEGGQAHRLMIVNGSSRTVHYFANGLSEGEQATLRDLERAENEQYYSDNLMALRRQYVHSERLLEPQRRATEEALYGTNITTTSYGGLNLALAPGLVGYGYGYGSGFGYPYAYPFNYGGYTFGYPAYGGLGAGGTTTMTRSVAYGVGDEGAIKDAMAATIARQATPEYTAQAARNYDTALARATESGPIRVALGLPDRPGSGKVVGAAYGSGRPPVTLTLKGGERIEGSKLREEADWYIVERAHDEVQVRKSEVTRIDRARQ